MAKLSNVSGSLCVLVFMLRISFIISDNDYYLYDTLTHHRSQHSVELELLEDTGGSIITKRSAVSQKPERLTVETLTSLASPSRPPVAETSTILPVVSNNTDDLPNTVKSKTPKTTKNISNQYSTKRPPAILKDPKKNLGENGHGIRKPIVPSSTIPTVGVYPTSAPSKPTQHTTMNPIALSSDISNLPNLSQHTTHDIITPVKKFHFGEEYDGSDVDISNFANEVDDKTLNEHNITASQTDSHIYYTSTIKTDPKSGQHYWVDLNGIPETKVHEVLSQSHRRAATVTLSFEFPFYGHMIKNITIATGGFLYVGNFIHAWLAATQYIAPLMANFDMNLTNESFVKYYDNGTAFTVMWQSVALQDRPNDGEFTFQATLINNGDIYFVYKDVPVVIEQIHDDYHPVKVGLSDAYIIDRMAYFVRRKTIYEYHRVNFEKEDIKNWTVIYLKALPTCLSFKDCESCLGTQLDSFNCSWCPAVQRCSSGLDRYRHTWLIKNCDRNSIKNETWCSHPIATDMVDNSDLTYAHDSSSYNRAKSSLIEETESNHVYKAQHVLPRGPAGMGVSGIVAMLLLISMVGGMTFWVVYAYRNPHTTSGQILIRYRPSQWRWKRGEARYTAATIHM